MLLSIDGRGMAETATSLTIFYCVHQTGRDRRNLGVQRVSRDLGAALQKIERVQLRPVRWCTETRAIVHAERHFCETMGLHQGPQFAATGQAGEPIPDTSSNACLLVPDVPYLQGHDERYSPVLLSTLIGDAQRRRLKSATLFHGLLPLTHAHVETPDPWVVSASQSYGFALSLVDAVFPTSYASEADLRQWWLKNGVGRQPRCKITAMRLPAEFKRERRRTGRAAASERTLDFVSVGTIRKRKNQIAAMRAFKAFARRNPAVKSRLLVVGSVSPDVAAQASYEASTSDGCIVLMGHRSDPEAVRLVQQARATVCVPLAAGFGLPVVESLWLGAPCICSNTGPVAEAAAGGGCLTIDPTDEGEIASAFERLASDDALYNRLSAEIEELPLTTWDSYASSIVGGIESLMDVRPRLASMQMPPKTVFERSYRGTW